MLRLYIKVVRAGRRDLDSVPDEFRDEVKKALEEDDD